MAARQDAKTDGCVARRRTKSNVTPQPAKLIIVGIVPRVVSSGSVVVSGRELEEGFGVEEAG